MSEVILLNPASPDRRNLKSLRPYRGQILPYDIREPNDGKELQELEDRVISKGTSLDDSIFDSDDSEDSDRGSKIVGGSPIMMPIQLNKVGSWLPGSEAFEEFHQILFDVCTAMENIDEGSLASDNPIVTSSPRNWLSFQSFHKFVMRKAKQILGLSARVG